jgi:beta-lactamase regulating signal transducer with metallopeptidase domain
MIDINLFHIDQLIQATGWTLIHSLWQLTAVALILRIALLLLKNKSAALRYGFSVAALLLASGLLVGTFVYEYSNAEIQPAAAENITFSFNETTAGRSIAGIEESATISGILQSLETFFKQNMHYIVAGWNICVLILFLRFLGGILYAQRLKRSGIDSLQPDRQQFFLRKAKQMGIQKSIRIMESVAVKVPVVIGWLKPVILIPAGLISGLSPDQVEAVIAHELAHIKRHDYLVNLFQSLAEILLFYHPAAWYISRNIRYERENACDDLAVANHTNRMSLAKALTNIEIINHPKTQIIMAFTRNNQTLLKRIQRIVGLQKRRFTFKDGIVSILIIALGLFVMSFSSKLIFQPDKTTAKPEHSSPTPFITPEMNRKAENNTLQNIEPPAINDTIIGTIKDDYIKYSVNGTSYKLNFTDDKKVSAFFIDNKEIPKSEHSNYKKEIDLGFALVKKHETAMALHKEKMQKHESEMRKHEEKMEELGQKMQKLGDELQESLPDMHKHDEAMAELEKQMQIHAKEMEALGEKMRKEMPDFLQGEEATEEFKRQMKMLSEEMQEHGKEMKIYAEKMKEAYKDVYTEEFEQKMDKFKSEMKEHAEEMKEHAKVMAAYGEKIKIISELIDEMKKDGLIEKEATSYRLTLGDNLLKINDEKQPKAVYEKYKKLFDQKAEGKFEFEGEYNFTEN